VPPRSPILCSEGVHALRVGVRRARAPLCSLFVP
jgi:hypothetical protein